MTELFTKEELPEDYFMLIAKLPSGREVATAVKNTATNEQVFNAFTSLRESVRLVG